MAVVAVLALVAMACGNDDGGSESSTTSQASSTTATEPSTTDGGHTTTTLVVDAPAAPGGCIEFEDVPLAAIFAVGDLFFSNGHNLVVEGFDWLPTGSTTSGLAEVQDQGLGGGSGQDLWTNNVRVRLRYEPPASHVTMRFGEYGGNVNLIINGDAASVEDFNDLVGATLGGVVVNASGPGAGGQGTGVIELDGSLEGLAIGGQEFVFDELCSAE